MAITYRGERFEGYNKPPRKGESEADKAKRRAFKARFADQIEKGRKDKTASAAYWADKVKW